MQTGEVTRDWERRFQCRVAVGLPFKGGGGEKLSGPGDVLLLLLEGEHRRDKPRGGLAVRANSGCSASAVSSRWGIRLGVTLLPLARFAVDEELFLGTPEEVLKTAFLPESEALSHFGRGAKPWGYGGQEELRAPLLQQRTVIAAPGHALPAMLGGRDHAQAAAGGDVEQSVGREQAVPLGEVRRQLQLREFSARHAAVPPSAPATPVAAVGAPRGPMMTSPTAGGRAGWPAHTDYTVPHQIVGGRCRREPLDGHEQSAGVLVDDRTRVVMGDVSHRTLGALETPARTLAATV